MTAFAWILVAALVSAPSADNKEKDKKKPPDKAAPAAGTPADLLRQAEEKVSAGDLDGAADLLR